MRTTRVLGGVVLVALLGGCGEATPAEPAAGQGGATPTESAADQGGAAPGGEAANATTTPDDAGPSPATLEGEEQYLAFLAAALDWSYGMAPEDGTVEVLQGMEGYGSLRWRADDGQDVEVLVTHRYVEDEWEWVYVDEAIDVNSVTPDALSAEETASFQSLADDLVAAIGVAGPVTLEHGFKQPGGVSQADFVVATDDGDASLHVAADGTGHIGRIDVDWPEI